MTDTRIPQQKLQINILQVILVFIDFIEFVSMFKFIHTKFLINVFK